MRSGVNPEGVSTGLVLVRIDAVVAPSSFIGVHGNRDGHIFVQGPTMAEHVFLLHLHVGLVHPPVVARDVALFSSWVVARLIAPYLPPFSMRLLGIERNPQASAGVVSGNDAGPWPASALPRRSPGEEGVPAAEDALDGLPPLPGRLATGLREFARAAAPPCAAMHAADDGEVRVDLGHAVAIRRIGARAVSKGGS